MARGLDAFKQNQDFQLANPNGRGLDAFLPPETVAQRKKIQQVDLADQRHNDMYGLDTTPAPILQPQEPPKPAPWGLDKLEQMDPLGINKFIANNPIGKFLNRTSQQGNNVAFNGGENIPGQQLSDTGNETANKIADFLGYGGLFMNPGAGLQKLGANVATQGLSKLAPSLGGTANKVLSNAIGAGALGAGIGTQEAAAKSLDNPNYTTGQAAKDVAENSLLFAGGDLALAGLGAGLKVAADKTGLTQWAKGLFERMGKDPAAFEMTPTEPAAQIQPLPSRNQIPFTLKPIDPKQKAMNELYKGIETAQNYIGHNDILAPYPKGTTLDQAFADIKTNTGVDLPKLINNAEIAQAKPLSAQLQNAAEISRLGRVAGAFDVKPLNTLQKPLLQPKLQPLDTTQTAPILPKLQKELSPAPLLPKAEIKPLPNAPILPSEPLKQRGFINTLQNSEKSSQGLLERLQGAYKPITNEELVAKANQRVGSNIDQAAEYVMSADKMTPEHITTAHRLIDEFQKRGQFDKAVDIAERVAEAGTKAGQSVQSFSIYNRLTPQGILVHAGRIVNRVNQKVGVLGKEAKLTSDTAEKLTDLASTVQTMTGTKQAANDVLNIMGKAKTGAKLTDDELNTIKGFVNDAKSVIGDLAPRRAAKQTKAPAAMLQTKVRDNVINFLDAQEQAAKERLRARGYRVMSGIPVDDFYDWSIIGASKMAKGVVKFADFSEQMIKDFGEQVKPYINQIYDKASEVFNGSVKQATKLSDVERITERAIKNKELSEQEAEALRVMAQDVSKMTGDLKIEAMQELQSTLQMLERSTVGKKISSVQTMAQLLNPKTILVRNPLGNEMFYRLERINKLVTTPIDWGRVNLSNKLLGTNLQRSVTFKTNNQGHYWNNWLKGLQAGWKGVNPEGLTTQFDLHAPAFSNKWNPLTYLEKAVGATLKSFDYAAYKRAVNNTIGEMATLRAVNEGLTGEAKQQAIQKYIREADENVLRIADAYGKYVTFQDNNLISNGLQKFKHGLNLGKNFGLGDLIVKYPKTPGAILMRALEYSPVGFLKSAYTLAGPLFKREPNTQEVLMSLSRAITGTLGLSGVGYYLIDIGILTGSASKDKDIRELQKSTGEGPYRLNMTALTRWVKSGFNRDEAKPREGDILISYDWMQPIAINVALGANAKQNLSTKKTDLGQILGDGYSIVDGAINSLVEQSVLQGIKKAFEGNPGQSATDKLFNIVSDLPASFAPTIGNQLRQLTDNTTRNTYDPNMLQKIGNQVKNKVPGLAQSLPPAFDTLGKPKENFQNGTNNLFNVFLNPGFTSKYKLTPEAKLVVDLIKNTGDETLAPRLPGTSITIKGQRYDLTPSEYSQLQRSTGEETAQMLRQINPSSPDEVKAKAIQNILRIAGERARAEIMKNHPEIKKAK